MSPGKTTNSKTGQHKGPTTAKKDKSPSIKTREAASRLFLVMAQLRMLSGKYTPMSKKLLSSILGYTNHQSAAPKAVFKFMESQGDAIVATGNGNVTLTKEGEARIPSVRRETDPGLLLDQLVAYLAMAEPQINSMKQKDKLRNKILSRLSDGRFHKIRDLAEHAGHTTVDSPSFKIHITIMKRYGLAKTSKDEDAEEVLRLTASAFPVTEA